MTAQTITKIEIEAFIMEKHVFTKMKVTEKTIVDRDALKVKSSNPKLIKLLLDQENFSGENLDAELDVRALIILKIPDGSEKRIAVSRFGISLNNQTPTKLPKNSRVEKALRKMSPMRYGW